MPRNSKSVVQPIQKELAKWLTRSRQMRTSSGIAYGKIKGYMAVLETWASKEELNDLQSELGK